MTNHQDIIQSHHRRKTPVADRLQGPMIKSSLHQLLANDKSNELSTMKRVHSLWFSIGCNKFFLWPKISDQYLQTKSLRIDSHKKFSYISNVQVFLLEIWSLLFNSSFSSKILMISELERLTIKLQYTLGGISKFKFSYERNLAREIIQEQIYIYVGTMCTVVIKVPLGLVFQNLYKIVTQEVSPDIHVRQ